MKKAIIILMVLLFISTTILVVNSEESLTDVNDEPLTEVEVESSTENNRKPTTLPEGDYYIGDLNSDGYITAADGRMVLKFTAKQILLSERQCILADANFNKVVNAQDARLVLRMSAKVDEIKKCPSAASANADRYIASYDKRTFYQPYLNGFSTNITDESVFSKIRALEDYCYNLGYVATFYYTDVNNEYYIQYNSDKVYRTQCTIKAPYIKSLLEYMESNNISLDHVIYLRSNQKWSGHYLSNFSSGTGFTIREIMYYAIRNSDNTAYQMLFDYFGPQIINDNAKKIGSTLRLDTYMFGESSAANMAKHYLDIYNYNGRYKDEFFENLSNSYTTHLIKNGIPDNVTVMRKSGSGGSKTVGYHDCAIVMTEQPFVLVIYTSINMDRYYDKLPFQRIAEMVYQINTSMEF